MHVKVPAHGNWQGVVAVKPTDQPAIQDSYRKLFDRQMQTLKERYCKEPIVALLESQRSTVIIKALGMEIISRHIPFLPVIHRSYMSTYDQMVMVQHELKIGYNGEVQPIDVHQLVKTPKTPYIIFNIEDGRATKGMVPQENRRYFRGVGRRGLTETEIISLCMHTDVLDRHFVSAAGCRLGIGKVPAIYLNGAGPTMMWQLSELATPRYGIPSCAI